MKILFCLSARMGDVICGIPAYLALRKKYPNDDLNWVTLEVHKQLIPKCGNVLVSGKPPFGDVPSWAEEFDLVIRAQPMWRHREWERAGKHIIDLCAKWAGVELEERRIYIETSKEDKEALGSLKLPDGPFATICSSPCYSCADWPMQHRARIVGKCGKGGIPFVTVGGRDGRDIPGAISTHGRLSISQSLALIKKSRLYVGPDTGVTWLACAAHKTTKLCITDKNRLRQGTSGFQRYLDDKNIRDSFYSDDVDKHIKILRELWNG